MSPLDPGYVPVAARVIKFRADHPTWALISTIVADDLDRVLIVAQVHDDNGLVVATGHAEESRDTDFPVEKCETSAWGRALANLGYEVVAGIASAEEMDRVPRRGPTAGPAPRKARGVPPSTGAGNGGSDFATARSATVRRVRLISDGDPAAFESLKGWLARVGLPEHVSKMNAKHLAAFNREMDRRGHPIPDPLPVDNPVENV